MISVLKVCKNCNKEYNARKSKQNFCSRKCTYEYRSKHLVGENASNYKNGNRVLKTLLFFRVQSLNANIDSF